MTNPVTAPTGGIAIPLAQPPGARGSDALGQAAFLRLMTAQMQQQDPFKPSDQTQMIAQLAQFAQAAGIGEMNLRLGAITDVLDAQTALLDRLPSVLPTLSPPAAPTPAPTPTATPNPASTITTTTTGA